MEKVFKEAVDELYGKTKQLIMNMSLINYSISASDDNNKSLIELITENLTQLASASNQAEDPIFKKVLNESMEAILDSIKKRCHQIRHSELKDIIQVVEQLKKMQQSILSEEE